jgi:hypothetical protein
MTRLTRWPEDGADRDGPRTQDADKIAQELKDLGVSQGITRWCEGERA